jgi:mono/diheme cytochrome c family protein
MLPVLLFVAFWAVLGLGLFVVAMLGGPRGGRPRLPRPTPGGRLATGFSFVALYVGFGIALPLLFLHGNHTNANAQYAGLKLTAGERTGRELFGEHCAVCHTLAAANAVGKVGPDLDQIQPSDSLVLHTMTYGCLQSPPTSDASETCLGQGTMPAGIVQGKQAEDVAAFVARVAGKG